MSLLDLLSSKERVSGEVIARSLDISRAAVHKRIQKLRLQGYEIAGEKKLGYTLVSRPDAVSDQEIRYHLCREKADAYTIVSYPSVDSTQTLAKEMAQRQAKDRTLVVAECQTESYGRRGRSWAAPKGGLWFSLVLRPDLPPESAPQLTLIASLAVCRAVERLYSVSALIKWPNDVVVKEKKLSGILTEISAEVGRLNWVVIGIGINVNNTLPTPLKETATSIGELLGDRVRRAELLSAILKEFGALYSSFCGEGFARFESEYNRRSMLTGKQVSIGNGDARFTGYAEKIDGDGYLWLRLPGGKIQKIIAGDITVLGNGK